MIGASGLDRFALQSSRQSIYGLLGECTLSQREKTSTVYFGVFLALQKWCSPSVLFSTRKSEASK
jgi:hypothetical protein